MRKAGIFKAVLNKITILEKYHNRKVVRHHARIASMWVKVQKTFLVLSSIRCLEVKTWNFILHHKIYCFDETLDGIGQNYKYYSLMESCKQNVVTRRRWMCEQVSWDVSTSWYTCHVTLSIQVLLVAESKDKKMSHQNFQMFQLAVEWHVTLAHKINDFIPKLTI